MIIASFLLVLAALVLLVVGVLQGSVALVVAAIVASLLAAVALVIAVRQRAVPAATSGADAPPAGFGGTSSGPTGASVGSSTVPPQESMSPPPTRSGEGAVGSAGSPSHEHGVAPPLPPADEPGEETTSAENAARLQDRTDEVVVVDGRPRYHVRTCGHLLGRTTVPLPVNAARGTGFTPCALCTPDRVLLGGG